MEAGKHSFLHRHMNHFGIREGAGGGHIIQLNRNVSGKAAQKGRRQLFGLVHGGKAVKAVIVCTGGNRLGGAGHIAVPFIQPPGPVALVGAGSQVVQVVGLVPEGQAASGLFVLDSGNPVHQTAGYSAVVHFGILVKADLRNFRNALGAVGFIILAPIGTLPDISEVIHMPRHII